MDNMTFISAIPRIKVLETRLLDKSKFDRMIECSTPWDAVKILQETEYATHMSYVKKAEDYEYMLSLELSRLYKLLYELSPVKVLVDIMSIKYKYHNMKVLLKAKALNKDFHELLIPIEVADFEQLKAAIENNDYRNLSTFMAEAAEQASVDYEINKNPQNIDIILDRFLFSEMVSMSKEINSDFIKKFVQAQIDLINIKSVIRVKRQNKGREFLEPILIEGGAIDKSRLNALLLDSVESIPGRFAYSQYAEVLSSGIEEYRKDGSLNKLEILIDNFIMKLMKDAKYMSSGPEPLIAYIYAKENEIRLIRIIMVGKINKLSSDEIRERLRDNYV